MSNSNYFINLQPTVVEASKVLTDENMFQNEDKKAIKILKKFITYDDSIEEYEKNNILLIDGDRGSGKTSNLLTLKNYIEKINSLQDDKNKQNNDLTKICVIDDLIDPSMFNENDDIIHLIIANMFKSVTKNDNYLRITIDNNVNIYDDFLSIIKTLSFKLKDLNESIDLINSLDNLSNYYNVKKLIQKLVKSYLQVKSKLDHREYSDIAIFIDDIDLNTENSFLMLEQIRKYLKQNHIIIIMGIKLRSLKNVLNRKYKNDYDSILVNNNDEDLNYDINVKDIKSMSDDYIKKIFPINYTITLPDKQKLYNRYLDAFKSLFSDKVFVDIPSLEFDFLDLFLHNSLRENNQLYCRLSDFDSVKIIDSKIYIPCEMYDFFGFKKNFKSIQSTDDCYILTYNNIIFNVFDYIERYRDFSNKNYTIIFNLLLSWYGKKYTINDLVNDNDILKQCTLICKKSINNDEIDFNVFNKKDKYYFFDIFNFDDSIKINDRYYILIKLNEKRERISDFNSIKEYKRFINELVFNKEIIVENQDLYKIIINTYMLNMNSLNFASTNNYNYIMEMIHEMEDKKNLTIKDMNELEENISLTEYSDILNSPRYKMIYENYERDCETLKLLRKSTSSARRKMLKEKLRYLTVYLTRKNREQRR